MKTVSDVLSRKDNRIWTIHPEDTVFDAIRMMADHEIGALPVMVDDEMRGIISERDYARKVILKDKASKSTSVADIMTSRVITAEPQERVEDCISKMQSNHIRHLPVVEDERVVGILSLRDLFVALLEDQASTIDQMEHYIRGDV